VTGKVVTFYSYGGAGRTMALANVAWRLAKRGLRVVAVDCDLQAPSLHYFLAGSKVDDPDAFGLLEFFEDWRHDVDVCAPEAPSVLPNLYSASIAHEPGSLRVLAAGRLDATYGARMDVFDIRAFYTMDCGGGAVEAIRQQLAGVADLVLVDSPAGMTDMGGACAIQLPDGVVFVSLPNERCYQGARHTARGVLKAPTTYRAGREAPTTWLVLSRTPRDLRDLEPWLDAHAGSFADDVKAGLWTGAHPHGLATHCLPEDPRYAFGDPIVPQEGSALGDAYDELATTLAAWAKP